MSADRPNDSSSEYAPSSADEDEEANSPSDSDFEDIVATKTPKRKRARQPRKTKRAPAANEESPATAAEAEDNERHSSFAYQPLNWPLRGSFGARPIGNLATRMAVLLAAKSPCVRECLRRIGHT